MANDNSGVYQIFIELDQERIIDAGRLGSFMLPKGRHIYTGRAKRNLSQRIERHQRYDKKYFWHIDYLLADEHARINDIIINSDNYNGECSKNQKVTNSTIVILIENFGSSDCKHNCDGRLVYLGQACLTRIPSFINSTSRVSTT